MNKPIDWQAGTSEEIAFWREYIATRGLRWPENYQRKLDPNATLLPAVEEEVVHTAPPIEILDIGCGPASYLGRVSPSGKAISCVYTDALGQEYLQLWREAGITPPHPIVPVKAEDLDQEFPPDRFAIVFARNCLDHMQDPLEALRQMVRVTRPGGTVILLHYAHVGTMEKFVGLHQWNLFWDGNAYCLGSSEGSVVDLCQELSDIAVLETFVALNGNRGDDPKLQRAVFRKLQP